MTKQVLNCPSPLSDLGFKLNNSHSYIVGRTVPSYRIASERERRKWNLFRQALDKKDRKIFDEMMSYPRLYNAAGVMACKPVLLHPILMSIISEHYKQLKKLELIYQDHHGFLYDNHKDTPISV